jgi:hypothetical protein
MSYSITETQGAGLAVDRRQNALSLVVFMLSAIALPLRFAISPQLLDRVMDYTGDSGPFYEKLHIGTYAILLLVPLALFSQPFVLRGDEIGKFKALLGYCGLLALLMFYLFLAGHFSSSGFLIDTYVVAAGAGLLLLAQPPDLRRRLGDVTLAMLILSAAIGIVEEITRHRLLPYDAVELQFRPLGLTEHPLALGALCATAIGFTALARWPIWVRVAAIFVLFIGCAASGARFSLLCAATEIPILLLFTPWLQLSPKHEKQAKAFVLTLTLAGGALLVVVLFAGGLLSRFGNTLFDENFMARISIYDVFGLVPWQNVVFGMRGDELLAIVNKQLHLPTIESAPVVITMLFGLPAALYFAFTFGWFLLRMLRYAAFPAKLGATIFLLAALSNNALSSKTPVVAIALVLILAYARPGVPTARARQPERPPTR